MSIEVTTAVAADAVPNPQCGEISMSVDIMAFKHDRGSRPESPQVCKHAIGGAVCGALVHVVERSAATLGPNMYPVPDRPCPYAANMMDEAVIRPED